MSGLCLRCDWRGEAAGPACPRCGAPLYRPNDPPPARRPAARAEPVDLPAPDPANESDREEGMRAPIGPIRSPASAGSVAVAAAVAFGVVLLLLGRGASEPADRAGRDPAVSPSVTGLPGGILVYASRPGGGVSRLWLWDLGSGDVRRGPVIPAPLELTNIASPGFGWIGLTSSGRDGTLEAATLDDLGSSERAERLGTADLVTWTDGGASVVLVDQGPAVGGCRRDVRITAVHLDVEGSEVVLDRAICGHVDAVGRTSLGYFAELAGPAGIDVVGLGYRDAGVLLEEHELLGISPGGEMLVSPTASGGSALAYEQFRGAPVPYVVGGEPFTIDRVLAYGPGSIEALVLGRAGDGDRGVYSLALRHDDRPSIAPRRLADARGAPAWAAYARDGTAFVLLGSRVWILREGRLAPLELPTGAPTPRGPLVWIQREPLTEL